MEHLHAHALAIGIDVGLFGRHPHGLHPRMFEHDARHVVAQGFLQMDVAARDTRGDHAAHEVVIDHFVELVLLRGGHGQRNEQIDIDEHTLLAPLLELVHTDIDVDFVVLQKQAAASAQGGVRQGTEHGEIP